MGAAVVRICSSSTVITEGKGWKIQSNLLYWRKKHEKIFPSYFNKFDKISWKCNPKTFHDKPVVCLRNGVYWDACEKFVNIVLASQESRKCQWNRSQRIICGSWMVSGIKRQIMFGSSFLWLLRGSGARSSINGRLSGPSPLLFNANNEKIIRQPSLCC